MARAISEVKESVVLCTTLFQRHTPPNLAQLRILISLFISLALLLQQTDSSESLLFILLSIMLSCFLNPFIYTLLSFGASSFPVKLCRSILPTFISVPCGFDSGPRRCHTRVLKGWSLQCRLGVPGLGVALRCSLGEGGGRFSLNPIPYTLNP